MPDPDVKINVEITKSGAGAQQAKAELDDLKKTAESSGASTGNLHTRMGGLSLALRGLTSILQGASDGIRGMAMASAGFFQVIVAHPIGRLIAVLVVLGTVLYELYNKFLHPKKGAKELADEAEKTTAKLKELNQVELPFEAARKGLADLANKYKEAIAQAKALQQAQDELADAKLATRLQELGFQEEQALAAAGPDESRRKAIQYDFSQRKTGARYEREVEKTATEQSERSRSTWAARNEKEQLDRKLPSLEATAQTYSDRLKRLAENPALLAAVDKETIAGNKQQLKEFEQIIRSTKERLAALNSEIRTAEIAEKAALEKRRSIDAEFQASRAKSAREYTEEQRKTTSAETVTLAEDEARKASTPTEKASAAKKIRDLKLSEAASPAQKAHIENEYQMALVEADKKAIEKRAELALQKEQAEEENAKIQLQAATKMAGDKKLTPRERRAAKEAIPSAQAAFGRESADVSQAEAYVSKIRETVDPAALANLIKAIESIGQNVSEALNKAAGVANQQASQIKNGGLRTK
ncbi:MAG: hypothetical protein NT011_13450 [Kiritimatiellaeota bacterium]|nr:hypothetical protein [Kiritimatiellota bacterium]